MRYEMRLVVTNGLKVYAQHKTSSRRKALTFNDLRRKRRQAKALRIWKTAPYRTRLSVFRRHRQRHLAEGWDRLRHLQPSGYPGGPAEKSSAVILHHQSGNNRTTTGQFLALRENDWHPFAPLVY